MADINILLVPICIVSIKHFIFVTIFLSMKDATHTPGKRENKQFTQQITQLPWVFLEEVFLGLTVNQFQNILISGLTLLFSKPFPALLKYALKFLQIFSMFSNTIY